MKFRIAPLLFLSVFFISTANAQSSKDSLFQYIDSVISKVRKDAYNATEVDWNEIKDSMYYYASKSTSIADSDSVFNYLFRKLDDNHGGVLYDNNYFGTYSKAKADPIKDSLSKRVRAKEFPFTAKRINGYGYLLLPSLGALKHKDIELTAMRIRDSICKSEFKHVKGWIIDLRFNPGGNLYIFATGLAGFLSQNQKLVYANKNGDTTISMQMKDYNWVSGVNEPTHLTHICKIISTRSKLVILTSRYTGSAGEMSAFLLRQRPNSIIIGERTSGFTSGTMYRSIFPNFGVNYTTSFPLTKNGKPFFYIEPDILLTGNFNKESSRDIHIQAALEWLNKR